MPTFDLPYEIPFGKGVSVLAYHPMGLIALEKPEGLLSTPNSEKDLNRTVVRAKFHKKKEAYVWFDSEQVQRFLYVCHRLDSHTSGVILCSLDQEVAFESRELFRNKEIHKEYIAILGGNLKEDSGRWTDMLKSSREGNQIRVKVARNGELASASWQVIERRTSPYLSLVSLKPHTGRTHQLRVQTGSRNMGIVGDLTYGDFKLNTRMRKEFRVKRLCLHSHRIEIDSVDFLGSRFRFSAESPVPASFTQLFDKQ